MQPPDDVADLIEQPGLAPSRGRILMPVHAVFPYGGARGPVYYPLHRQGLVSLCRCPRRDIIRRRGGSPQPPTVSQPIPGQDRDEAGAKYFMPRVLHFANGVPAVYRDDGSAFHFMVGGIGLSFQLPAL